MFMQSIEKGNFIVQKEIVLSLLQPVCAGKGYKTQFDNSTSSQTILAPFSNDLNLYS